MVGAVEVVIEVEQEVEVREQGHWKLQSQQVGREVILVNSAGAQVVSGEVVEEEELVVVLSVLRTGVALGRHHPNRSDLESGPEVKDWWLVVLEQD